MKRFITATALCFSFSFLSQAASAATYSIASMNITSGGFSIVGVPDSFTAFDYIGPNTNLVGGYIGAGGAGLHETIPDPYRIAGLQWLDYPMNFYTAAASLEDINNPAGTYPGGPVPGGVLDDASGTITMDLSSWFRNWHEYDQMTGTGRNDGYTSALATGIWNPTTHVYILHWDSRTLGPPCLRPGGCVTHWTLEGTASPVPLPAAIWLFSSGLLGLFGWQWRRKSKNN